MQLEYICMKLIGTKFFGVGAFFCSFYADLRRIAYTRGCAYVMSSFANDHKCIVKNKYNHAKTRFLILDNAKRLKENPVVFASATHVTAPCSQQLRMSTHQSPFADENGIS